MLVVMVKELRMSMAIEAEGCVGGNSINGFVILRNSTTFFVQSEHGRMFGATSDSMCGQ